MWPRVWSRHFLKPSSCFTSGCCDTVWSPWLVGESINNLRQWLNILCSYLFEEFVLGRWLMSSILCQDRQGENAGHFGVSWRVSICVLWFITHAPYIVSCYLWALIKVTSFVCVCVCVCVCVYIYIYIYMQTDKLLIFLRLSCSQVKRPVCRRWHVRTFCVCSFTYRWVNRCSATQNNIDCTLWVAYRCGLFVCLVVALFPVILIK